MSPAIVALSWTTVAWSACAAACATLALVYAYIGLSQRSGANLAFALSATSVAVMSAFELALQRVVGRCDQKHAHQYLPRTRPPSTRRKAPVV